MFSTKKNKKNLKNIFLSSVKTSSGDILGGASLMHESQLCLLQGGLSTLTVVSLGPQLNEYLIQSKIQPSAVCHLAKSLILGLISLGHPNECCMRRAVTCTHMTLLHFEKSHFFSHF